MKLVIALSDIRDAPVAWVGGKATALARMKWAGVPVPDAVCVTSEAYRLFVSEGGLKERILMELSRKPFAQMRWEEVWDAALRIRNLFLTTPWPPHLYAALAEGLNGFLDERPLVVRSSCPGEDSAESSFAGLHESYVNVRGLEATLERIKGVWASLWSDGALLYRRELGGDVHLSTMAVIVQHLVTGEVSGVGFSQSPHTSSEGAVEAVYGLNQGLVDGTIEPDHWRLDRETGAVLEHREPLRSSYVGPDSTGVRAFPLSGAKAQTPPLMPEEVTRIFELACRLERLFGAAQDLEWTLAKGTLHALQSRPITTLDSGDSSDRNGLYQSLHRSYENLNALRERIENHLLPEMVRAVDDMAEAPLLTLSDRDLAEEIKARLEVNERWVQVYWTEFIPYAHGIRLFGQVYNDAVKPEDPFEFTSLLTHTPLMGMARNRRLNELAELFRTRGDLGQEAGRNPIHLPPELEEPLTAYIDTYGAFPWLEGEGSRSQQTRASLVTLLFEMARHPPASEPTIEAAPQLEAQFLGCFAEGEKAYARGVLALGRSSYRLRDDDNIYMGQLETQLLRAVDEGRKRLEEGHEDTVTAQLRDEIERFGIRSTIKSAASDTPVGGPVVKARQIMGQPAGQGMAQGRARVIRTPKDLGGLKHGEILVCDVVEPNMTWAVPLAAGIVERRGGMLIHGAIIAREYGLPCVTGVPDATQRIETGDRVTVDGYLGMVILGESTSVF
ncbi:PEP/pyruvate-binding domain-containing protein [Desulfoluna sp.]|uniref:PEP/pyruvate-binding domain-containing protein n=1 Tax=Desulfoluna sp. TaxID=2045199 RepID=UPI002636D79D|nr:PEP/pyruvate-binding domain-containing protein [Desulfoluna sp.]